MEDNDISGEVRQGGKRVLGALDKDHALLVLASCGGKQQEIAPRRGLKFRLGLGQRWTLGYCFLQQPSRQKL